MRLQKISLFVLLTFLFGSIASPQSLVELSKKEKERREKVKQKKSIVITNADLNRMKTKPAVDNQIVPPTLEELVQSLERILEGGEEVAQKLPEAAPENTATTEEPTIAVLEENWKKAEEYASLLALKIRALLQEFYSMDDMTDKASIQKQLSETSQKLEQAQKDTEKAKKEYDQAMAQMIKKKRSI